MYRDKLLVQFLSTLPENDWEVTFVQSPRVCQGTPPPILTELFPDVTRDEMREWVNSKSLDDNNNNKPAADAAYTKEYDGLQDALIFLREYLQDEPRFDVIAGHSNGALMASILAFHMQHQPEWLLPSHKHCKTILCMNAPNSYDTEVCLGPLVAEYGPVTSISSLHVLGGPTDFTYEGSKQLQQVHHPGARVLEHNAGHFFPTEQHYYDDMLKALNEMMET